MVLGALWCPDEKRKEIFERIREIKADHGFGNDFEIKWNKVSRSYVDLYLDLVNYFFDDDDMHFRALVIPDKSALDHKKFDQDHDTFYYKMYFDLIKVILNPEYAFNIYIDIKDTRSQDKVNKLLEVLRNNHYDFNKKIIRKVQQVHSHEVGTLQIADLLTGAISYLHRGLSGNKGKEVLIERIKRRSGYALNHSTLYKENKFNLFVWQPRIIE